MKAENFLFLPDELPLYQIYAPPQNRMSKNADKKKKKATMRQPFSKHNCNGRVKTSMPIENRTKEEKSNEETQEFEVYA